jgi:hypothetical protein
MIWPFTHRRAPVRYPLTLRETLRYRYGLRWIDALPGWRDYWKDVAAVCVIVLLYGIAGSMDYATEKAEEAEQQAALAEKATARLAACMNGELRLVHEGPHKDGFGTTAVICRRAEEVRL